MATTKQNEKVRAFFKKYYNKSLSDPEIEEIHLSLFFLARAIHRYRLIQRGEIKSEK